MARGPSAPVRTIACLLLAAAIVPSVAQAQGATTGVLTPTAPVPGAPDVELLGPVAALPAKAQVNLFLSVVNRGPGEMRDVSTLVTTSGGLVLMGQVQVNLDDLPENNSTLLVVRVATPDQAGAAALAATFTFTAPSGALVNLTRVVSLRVGPPRSDPLQVTYAGDPLVAGATGALDLTIRNTGASAITSLDMDLAVRASGLTAALNGSGGADLAAAGEGSRLLQGASLAPGASTSVQVPVRTSLHPDDLLAFTVSARYSVDGFQRDQSFDFGARAVGSVALRILDAREVAAPEGPEIVGTLVNVGTGTAWNPRLTPAPGSGYAGDAPALLEDLKPNQAVDFTLHARRAATPPAGGPLLAIDWNDDFGALQHATIAGRATPLPAAAPTFWQRLGASLLSPLGVAALLGLAVLAGLAILAARLVASHRRAEEDAGESGEPSAQTPPRAHGRGRHRARPGP